MPQYQNWLIHIPLGNSERRERDRERKHTGAAKNGKAPRLATYRLIDKHLFCKVALDGYVIHHYRLCDLAAIYGVTRSTVYRWYRSHMLPECFGGGKTYLKEQVLVICNVLNDIFDQGIRQFRKSHTAHIEMMQAGNDMVLRRFAIKLARGPKHPVKILPHPRERARLAELRNKPSYHVPYQPTIKEILCDTHNRF